MLAFLRLAVFGFAVLAVVFVFLRLFIRARRREHLEREWSQSQNSTGREDFVNAGLEALEEPLRRWLGLAVFGVPTLTIIIIIYVSNFA